MLISLGWARSPTHLHYLSQKRKPLLKDISMFTGLYGAVIDAVLLGQLVALPECHSPIPSLPLLISWHTFMSSIKRAIDCREGTP